MLKREMAEMELVSERLVLFPSCMRMRVVRLRVVRVRVTKVSSLIGNEWYLAALLREMVGGRVMQIRHTHRIDWWGCGLEVYVLLDREDCKGVPEEIDLRDSAMSVILIS